MWVHLRFVVLIWVCNQLAQWYGFSKKFWLLKCRHVGGDWMALTTARFCQEGPSQREAKESGVILTTNQRTLTGKGTKCGYEDKKRQWSGGSTPGLEVSMKEDSGEDKVVSVTMRLGKGVGRMKDFEGEGVKQLRGHNVHGSNTWILKSLPPITERGLKEGRRGINASRNLVDVWDSFHLHCYPTTLEYLSSLLHCSRTAEHQPHPLTDSTPVDSIIKQPSPSPPPITPSPLSSVLRLVTMELHCY